MAQDRLPDLSAILAVAEGQTKALEQLRDQRTESVSTETVPAPTVADVPNLLGKILEALQSLATALTSSEQVATHETYLNVTTDNWVEVGPFVYRAKTIWLDVWDNDILFSLSPHEGEWGNPIVVEAGNFRHIDSLCDRARVMSRYAGRPAQYQLVGWRPVLPQAAPPPGQS